MKNIATVKKSTYFDSVTLMGVSKKLESSEGILKVSVSMGTELNQGLLREAGMNTPETDAAGPNDLMIAVRCADEADPAEILRIVEEALHRRQASENESAEADPATIRTALHRMPDANLALISVPGAYAGFEAKRALEAGLHVMIFSDNVPLEEELMLKRLAHEKGLLLMGPDCGTAILDGVGLAFSNVVKHGPVGVVAASGTGMQEVTSLLDAANVGVSQAIGTGGRDLSDEVGGIMTLDAVKLLAEDDETRVIAVIGKACSESVAAKLENALAAAQKPAVVCFLGVKTPANEKNGIRFADTLEAVAEAAAQLAGGIPLKEEHEILKDESARIARLAPSQRFARGVFCGGTLANECRQIFKAMCPGLSVHSNISHDPAEALCGTESEAHTFLDMGDDAFTVGRAHPMIDPTLRNERILAEALDPETAVVIFDVVLGYGAAAYPLEGLSEAIETARTRLSKEGRDIIFIAHVLGTAGDPQDKASVEAALRQLGVSTAATNAQAARLCAHLIQEIGK